MQCTACVVVFLVLDAVVLARVVAVVMMDAVVAAVVAVAVGTG